MKYITGNTHKHDFLWMTQQYQYIQIINVVYIPIRLAEG